MLTCIREHLTIDTAGQRLAVNAERYLKPAAEMARLFRNMPDAIEETLALDAALSFSLDELQYEYPDECRRAGEQRATARPKVRAPDTRQKQARRRAKASPPRCARPSRLGRRGQTLPRGHPRPCARASRTS